MAILFETYCDECGALMAFMSSTPRGYMVCPACGEKHNEEEIERRLKGDSNG